MGLNLTNQYISGSFDKLLQVSGSDKITDGLGNQKTSFDISASYAVSASHADLASDAERLAGKLPATYATTGSNTFTGLQVLNPTSGVSSILSFGTINVAAGGVVSSDGFTGSLHGNADTATTASYALNGGDWDGQYSGSNVNITANRSTFNGDVRINGVPGNQYALYVNPESGSLAGIQTVVRGQGTNGYPVAYQGLYLNPQGQYVAGMAMQFDATDTGSVKPGWYMDSNGNGSAITSEDLFEINILNGDPLTINAPVILAQNATGSLFGTASYADRAALADFATLAQDSVYAQNTITTGKSLEASPILKGTPLYFTASGTSGNIVGVLIADAGNPNRMPAAGVAGTDIDPGEEGAILLDGYIGGVNTSAFQSGDEVFVAVGGGYTNVAPTGSGNLIQHLGNVEKSAINGSGVIQMMGEVRGLPNLQQGYLWVGGPGDVPQAISTGSITTEWDGTYTGSAGISGSLLVDGPITATGTVRDTVDYPAGGLNQVRTLNNVTDQNGLSYTSFEAYAKIPGSIGNQGKIRAYTAVPGQIYSSELHGPQNHVWNLRPSGSTSPGSTLQLVDSGNGETSFVVQADYQYLGTQATDVMDIIAGRKADSFVKLDSPNFIFTSSIQPGDSVFKFQGDQTQFSGSVSFQNIITGSIQNATTASYVGDALYTASAAANVLTLVKGDGTSFDVNIAQSGSVESASYASVADALTPGNKTISGDLNVIGSGTFSGSLDVNGVEYDTTNNVSITDVNGNEVFKVGGMLANKRQPVLFVSGGVEVNLPTFLSRVNIKGGSGNTVLAGANIGSNDATGQYSAGINGGSGGVLQVTDNFNSNDFGIAGDMNQWGYLGDWTGPGIFSNDPGGNYPTIIGFQNAQTWTDGRVTFLTPISASGGITGNLTVDGDTTFSGDVDVNLTNGDISSTFDIRKGISSYSLGINQFPGFTGSILSANSVDEFKITGDTRLSLDNTGYGGTNGVSLVSSQNIDLISANNTRITGSFITLDASSGTDVNGRLNVNLLNTGSQSFRVGTLDEFLILNIGNYVNPGTGQPTSTANMVFGGADQAFFSAEGDFYIKNIYNDTGSVTVWSENNLQLRGDTGMTIQGDDFNNLDYKVTVRGYDEQTFNAPGPFSQKNFLNIQSMGFDNGLTYNNSSFNMQHYGNDTSNYKKALVYEFWDSFGYNYGSEMMVGPKRAGMTIVPQGGGFGQQSYIEANQVSLTDGTSFLKMAGPTVQIGDTSFPTTQQISLKSVSTQITGSLNHSGSLNHIGNTVQTGFTTQNFTAPALNSENAFVNVSGASISGKPYNRVFQGIADYSGFGANFEDYFAIEYYDGFGYNFGSEFNVNGKQTNIQTSASGSGQVSYVRTTDNYDGTSQVSIGSGNKVVVNGLTEVTGSVNISQTMKLAPQDPLPAGNIGDLAVSGSSLYFYNGAWTLVV